jgi:alpha-tubulin suppressor-like RCC1 family protein
VYAWGGNEYNQCALESDQRGGAGRDVCMPVPILQDLKVRQVGSPPSRLAGCHPAAADIADARRRTRAERAPRLLPRLPRLALVQVAAGGMHSMALAEDGTVWAWGQPLCDYTNNSQRLPAPIPFFGTSNKIAKVSAGAFHNLALQVRAAGQRGPPCSTRSSSGHSPYFARGNAITHIPHYVDEPNLAEVRLY